jgi:pilus assembly protein FimV
MSKRAIEQVICCTLVCTAFGAQAVGFGRTTPSAVLGQPLNVLIPLRTEPGEVLTAQCVSAEVIAGENTLPASQVRVVLVQGSSEQDWIARISTTSPIEEPVIELAVSAGCERRFMRRFTALADPPTVSQRNIPANMGITAPVMMGSSFDSNELAPVARAPKRARSVVDRETRAERLAASEVAPKPSRSERRKEARADKSKTKSGASAAEIMLAGNAALPAVSPSPARAAVAAPNDAQMARLLLDVGSGPRLRMDIEEPLMRAPGGEVLAAASGALSGDAVGEDLRRLQALEKTLADLKRERQASVDASNTLRSRLADAESQSRLLPWLAGLLLLVGGVALWLAMRVRRQGKQREGTGVQWWASGQAQDSRGPVPEPVISGHDHYMAPADQGHSATKSGDASVWEPPAADESSMERTVVQPQSYGMSSSSGSFVDGATAVPREVSVEELLDLEQQADFFIALGQEDAAVDLLMTHLRGTGGLSPLPYTKLLEIYKRQGDPNAYERIRARFNRRFNVYAPDWEAGPLQGRTLEDYSDAVIQLQAVWASPLDAMAVLEAMLFRKDDAQDMFDLPAYKDVLLLYSLARDLWQQGGGSAAPEVDVLLPLGDVVASGPVELDDDPARGGFQLTSFEYPVIRDGAELNEAPNTGAGGLTLDRR